MFPDGMHEFEFSGDFDQPIADVERPSRLRVLKLGEHFNRRVEILWMCFWYMQLRSI